MLDETVVPESESDVMVRRARRPGSTIELSFFMTTLGLSLTGVAISNLILYRTCVHVLRHGRAECSSFLAVDKTNDTQYLEKEVQRYAIFVNSTKSVLESLAPAVLSLFLGSWSDRHGRKPLIVWPLFGIATTSMLVLIYSMVDVGPWWFILTSVPYSLAGGVATLSTGSYSYMSDVTSTEKRTARMFTVQLAASGGVVAGSLLSAPVLRAVGAVYLLLAGASVAAFTYAFTNVFLNESLTGVVQGSMTSIMDLQLVTDMSRECFRRRPNNGRAQVLVVAAASSLSAFVTFGIMNLEYLYTREKLHWTLSEFTVYSAVNTLLSFFGGLIGMSVLQGLFKISDLPLAAVAFVSAAAEYVAKTLAVDSWHMYLGASLAIFKGLSASLLRSFVSKVLPADVVTKFLALMSAVESLCPLLAPLVYSTLYGATVSTAPASVYVLSTGIIVFCIVLIGVVLYFRRHATTPYEVLQPEPF
ncbi:proton-coupled folate transporter-like [Bombyx mandarina]|uniref:Adenylate cyclase n=3 Tax=Bombyx TaxID=7090 RepID=A0A8R2QWG4_BOMMO|nr:proton-coupled folate transporter isoform X1 [Bombyx mori]XP_028041989.1 proton-coupled folate transporter-like [Bombyx mandarina]XP_037870533.1 proton-coupled folate transporter isoform X1 [Bombyx mori]